MVTIPGAEEPVASDGEDFRAAAECVKRPPGVSPSADLGASGLTERAVSLRG